MSGPSFSRARDPRRLIKQSGVRTSSSGTGEDVLATVSIPAGAMGANGRLIIYAVWTVTTSGNNKVTRIRFGGASGTIYGTSGNLTTQVTFQDYRTIANRNATNSQIGGGSTTPIGGTSSAVVTSTVDTTAAVDLVFSGECADGADFVHLESYEVWVVYGP